MAALKRVRRSPYDGEPMDRLMELMRKGTRQVAASEKVAAELEVSNPTTYADSLRRRFRTRRKRGDFPQFDRRAADRRKVLDGLADEKKALRSLHLALCAEREAKRAEAKAQGIDVENLEAERMRLEKAFSEVSWASESPENAINHLRQQQKTLEGAKVEYLRAADLAEETVKLLALVNDLGRLEKRIANFPALGIGED